jgi:cytoskeletal protein RodZ
MAPNQGATPAARAVEPPVASEAETRHFQEAAAFGAFLRAQREAQHLTVEQIGEITKIAPRYFRSLELGDIGRWPGGMYRRAMVRAYARAVGLDAEETVRTFLVVFSNDLPVATPDVAPNDARRAAVTGRAAAAAGVVGAAAAVLLAGWSVGSFILNAMRSDAVTPPQPLRAHASTMVETPVPPSPDRAATAASSTPTATSGTTDVSISSVAELSAGELRVQSDPDGARVTVNGIGWGLTPATIKHLALGEKRVRLTKDGYASAERRIQVTAEQPVQTVLVTLEPRADTH